MPEVIVSLSLDEMKNVTEIPILTDNFHNFTILSLSSGKSEQIFYENSNTYGQKCEIPLEALKILTFSHVKFPLKK
jgi:Leucine-rich repeat (LRR) protein